MTMQTNPSLRRPMIFFVLTFLCLLATGSGLYIFSRSLSPTSALAAVFTACPSNLLSGTNCIVDHLISSTPTSGTAPVGATIYSWVKSGVTYILNFGDGTEVQAPNCTFPYSNDPSSCTGRGYIGHTYATAGSYILRLIDYSCPASSSTCNRIIDSIIINVSSPTKPSCTLINGDGLPQLQSLVASGCTTITTAADATVNLSTTTPYTVPSTVTVAFLTGAKWSLGANTTITLDGPYAIPSDGNTYFIGTGKIVSRETYATSTCPVSKRVAYPEWFGARVNDSQDDSDAITKAFGLGNFVQLKAGTYDVKSRIWIDRGGTITGAGQSLTTLRQMRDANLIYYPDATHASYAELWSQILLQDFIIGLASNCSSAIDLTIDGSLLPDDLSQLSNTKSSFGTDPIVSAIQVSTSGGWQLGDPPIHNISIKNLTITLPASNCITLQSSRAADGVFIDSVTCSARTSRPNTSGMTIEAFHPTHANAFKNITVSNSTFTGGTYGLYIAGVQNLLIDHVTVTGTLGTVMAALFYTSDNGHSTTATVTNSTFSHPYPTASTEAVIKIAGRGYVKDLENVFPYLRDATTSLAFENTTISSTEYPTSPLIPLVRDVIGFTKPVTFKNTIFMGGSYGILAADPADPAKFGGQVYIQNPNGTASTMRDVTDAEISTNGVRHSDFVVSLTSKFYRQALSAIHVKLSSVKIFDTNFYNIGTSPNAVGFPVVNIGTLSPFSPATAPQFNIQYNSYSGLNANAFVQTPQTLLNSSLLIKNNALFKVDSNSRTSMESLRIVP